MPTFFLVSRRSGTFSNQLVQLFVVCYRGVKDCVKTYTIMPCKERS